LVIGCKKKLLEAGVNLLNGAAIATGTAMFKEQDEQGRATAKVARQTTPRYIKLTDDVDKVGAVTASQNYGKSSSFLVQTVKKTT